MGMFNYCVYQIQIDKYIYVGKTKSWGLRKRLMSHAYDLNRCRHHNNILQKLYDKHKPTYLDYIVLEDNIEERDIAECEMFWIAYFKYIGAYVINLTIGGEGCNGRIISQETREKIRNSHVGKKRSEQARLNMRNAQLGHKRTRESVEKSIAGTKGIKRTPEQCANIGNGRAVKRIEILISPDGIEYSNINNLATFAKEHNLSRRSLNSLFLRTRKEYKGWRLKE